MCFALDDTWRTCGCILNLAILPVICTIGLTLNILCLSVFHKTRTHPLVPALMVLSVCDILQLFLSFFVLFVPSLHDFTYADPFGMLGQIAYISTGALAPLLLASNCASIWTITYISIQRHQAITNPLRTLARPPRPYAPLVVITLVALAFNASKWFEYDWMWMNTPDNSSFLMYNPSALFYDAQYHQVIDYLLYPVCVYIIPLLVLTILHGRIFFKISLRRITSDHKGRLAEERRSIVLLISIVTLFFVCHTGGLVYRLMGIGRFETSEFIITIKDFINILFNINSMCNPMLYFFFTRQFRDLRGNFLQKQLISSRGSITNVRTELHEMSGLHADSLISTSTSNSLRVHGPSYLQPRLSASLRRENLLEAVDRRRRASSVT